MNAEINRSIVVLFLKGTPNNPSDGYQAKAIEYLNQTKVKYSWFNVMTDSDVREMLKDFSRWNSFP
jgi:monothiol glutaredoxin